MSMLRHLLPTILVFVLTTLLPTEQAHANQLVYVPLSRPCRLLETISPGGSGPLAATHGAYLFGSSDADVGSAAQHGNPTGCGVPAGAEAISVNLNMLNVSAPGNITTWSADAGTIMPVVGTGVYNPTVASAIAGEVQYNSGYTNVPVGAPSGSNPGRFYLQVANGQIDMTVNLVGYWLPVSWNESRSGSHAVALGDGTDASGVYSTAMGQNSVASGSTSVAAGAYADASGTGSIAMGVNVAASGEYATAIGSSTRANGVYSTAVGRDTLASGNMSVAIGAFTVASGESSTAIGNDTHASGIYSTAMGQDTHASGSTSVALGAHTVASGEGSTAMGLNTAASGHYSTAMGTAVSTNGHRGSFIYGDASPRTGIVNSEDNQFMAIASGGFVLVSSADGSTGVELKHGNSSWSVLSDRNAKTALQAVDGREVLTKVVALPLSTWQYKTQNPKYRHIGPMAQDFYAAFQLGESDKGIDTVDADGIALAAIQGLNALVAEKVAKTTARLDEKDQEIAALRNDKNQEIELLRSELTAQKTRMAALEMLAGNLAGDLADMKAEVASSRKSDFASAAVAPQKP